MNLVLALTILAKPMTVDADANFLIISPSFFILLKPCVYAIDKLDLKIKFQPMPNGF